jgi:hypothetical protein
VNDNDSDTTTKSLTRADIENAIYRMAKDTDSGIHAISDMLAETGDAATADIFMQFFVLGEIVYG